MRACVVIPTYNNAGTIGDVVSRAVAQRLPVIAVNDGSTDGTADVLRGLAERYGDSLTVVSYEPNGGKGIALQRGIDEARRQGYTHAVTIDADGQHYPEDAHRLTEVAMREPEAIVVGARGEHGGYKSAGSRFANRFSNFWFGVQTLTRGIDTQCGYRCYPLSRPLCRFHTSRYESELSVLVTQRWRGRRLVGADVRVYYPPREERVSHFRPGADFTRISLLNTVLCILAVVWGYPSMLYHKIRKLCGCSRLS